MEVRPRLLTGGLSHVNQESVNLDMNKASHPEQQEATTPPALRQVLPMKLSICITTFNRARFIGATLDSILGQLESNCEVVVVDGASSDNTEQVVSEYVRRFDNLRYIRQPINQGIDRDYDRTVQLACGEYCWLMTDDDLLKPGAIAKVLAALRGDLSLLLVNYQRLDNSMSEVLLNRFLETDTNITYSTDEMDRLFSDACVLLMYIGTLVIKRSIWMARNRQRYYDTMLMHIGVIFQEKLPGETLLIAEPLISYRDGNPRTFWPKMFEIFLVKFPANVSSFAISERERSKYLFGDPRKRATLLFYRAMGWYSLKEYQRWISPNVRSIRKRIVPALIAIAPGVLVNTYYILKPPAHPRGWKLTILHLRMSPFYFRNCRLLGHR